MSASGSTWSPAGSSVGWIGSSMGVTYSGSGAPPVEVLTADRQRCGVCGHPTGDCVGEHPGVESSIKFEMKRPDPNATFTVPRRVYTVTLQGKRQVRSLLYAAGDRITPDEARRLGLLPPQEAAPRRDEAVG